MSRDIRLTAEKILLQERQRAVFNTAPAFSACVASAAGRQNGFLKNRLEKRKRISYTLMVRQENMKEKAVRTIAICEDDRKERQELLMFVREAQKQLSFEMDAVHYLVKPVHMDSLLELVRRFFRRSGIPVKMLELKWGSKSLCVPMHRITRIQSSNKGVDVYLQGAGRPQWADVSFSKVEEMLDEEYFLRISRGLLVQMNYILCMEQNVCRFRDGTSSLISRREKKDIRRKYNDFLFRGMMEEEENE